ncbi:MAG: universal stress protein [Muribaculaceae bacterium]|nr:universal stress protein [Muribaculaceae bacterium]
MRLITVAIHTYDRAVALKNLLEKEGIETVLQNVNLEEPTVSSGVRVRIHERDLALALRVIENMDIFVARDVADNSDENVILVPVDFNDRTMNAVKVAFELAHEHSLDIKFMHTFIDPRPSVNVQLTPSLTYEVGDNKFRRQLEATAKTRMAHFADRVRDMLKAGLLPLVKFSTLVIEGVPEDAIVDYTKDYPPYMIVMGTRCAAQKEADMIGSVAAEVLDKCRCSVLTIPETATLDIDNNLRNIVFLTNLDQEDILALDTMSRIFVDTHANVRIVPIQGRKRFFEIRGARDSSERLLQYCRTNFSRFNFEIRNIDLEDGFERLEQLTEDGDIDLIVLPHKQKNIFARFFNPGMAHKILQSTDIPMLVIRV